MALDAGRLEAVVRLAAEAWERLEAMYREQDECRRRGGLPSWPRDRFESYVDALTTDAKTALGSGVNAAGQ